MSVAGKKIAILVDDYFEQAELEEPLKRLRQADATVTVLATNAKKIHGMQHTEKGDIFSADMLLADADPSEFEALVLPGGAINADALRMNKDARDWAARFTDEGKLVAAICHAPWLLVSADLVEGKRLTSYYTLQDDIRNAGAEWIDQPVILDGNLVTSRQPDDIPAFVQAIGQWFSAAAQSPGRQLTVGSSR